MDLSREQKDRCGILFGESWSDPVNSLARRVQDRWILPAGSCAGSFSCSLLLCATRFGWDHGLTSRLTTTRTPSDQSKRGKGNDCWDRDAIFGAGPCLELIPQTPERRWRQCTEDRKDHKGLKRNQAPV